MASNLRIQSEQGDIVLRFRPDSAPTTCEYIQKLVNHKLYDDCTFYRSDFVIQCGTHGLKKTNPEGDLPVNETHMNKVLSNVRGTASIAHWDVPDCGNVSIIATLS